MVVHQSIHHITSLKLGPVEEKHSTAAGYYCSRKLTLMDAAGSMVEIVLFGETIPDQLRTDAERRADRETASIDRIIHNVIAETQTEIVEVTGDVDAFPKH